MYGLDGQPRLGNICRVELIAEHSTPQNPNELPLDPVESPVTAKWPVANGLKTQFTAETARRAFEIKVNGKAERKELRKIAEIDPYTAGQLKLTRAHVEIAHKRLSEALSAPELDARAIESLSRSLTALREQERILAGRPLPGSFKPAAVRQPRQTGNVEPL